MTIKILAGLMLVPLTAFAQGKVTSSKSGDSTLITQGSTMWIVAGGTAAGVERMAKMFHRSVEDTAGGLAATQCSIALKAPKAIDQFKLVGAFTGSKVVVLTGDRNDMSKMCNMPATGMNDLLAPLRRFISKADIPVSN